MYNIGQYIVHPGQGVCRVEGVVEEPTAVYKLMPVGQRNPMRIIFPVASEGKLRPVLSHDEAMELIDQYATLQVDEYHAQLLPADKVKEVEKLLAQGTLAFVGDGINDAPVLTRSDIGIAMGALGSDAAIEAADVVLMDDKPSKIATAVRIARRTIRIAKENIGLAIGIKVLVLVLAVLGLATMWMAVFADVGVTVLAVLNAMRALKA